LSVGVAFRHQFLEKDEAEINVLIDSVPNPVKRERRRDLIFKGVDAPVFHEAVRMWAALVRDMDAALQGRDWLAGNAYSLAEAAYTPYITRLDHLNLMGFLDGYPNLAGWYDRVMVRPSYGLAFGDWNEEKYLTLMSEKGAAVWPRIQEMIAEAA